MINQHSSLFPGRSLCWAYPQPAEVLVPLASWEVAKVENNRCDSGGDRSVALMAAPFACGTPMYSAQFTCRKAQRLQDMTYQKHPRDMALAVERDSVGWWMSLKHWWLMCFSMCVPDRQGHVEDRALFCEAMPYTNEPVSARVATCALISASYEFITSAQVWILTSQRSFHGSSLYGPKIPKSRADHHAANEIVAGGHLSHDLLMIASHLGHSLVDGEVFQGPLRDLPQKFGINGLKVVNFHCLLKGHLRGIASLVHRGFEYLIWNA